MMGLCPSRSVRWDGSGGEIALRVPRRPPLALIARLLGRPQHVRLRLDELGSYVWSCCDGGTPVGEIVTAMAQRFGAEEEEMAPRVALFLNRLARERLITWEDPS
jgi:hypothetical protein